MTMLVDREVAGTKFRSPEITSKIMSKIRSSGSKAEVLLGKSMWVLGLRYRKQYRIRGRPDFVFVAARVSVFCDGDFWHGRHFKELVKAGRFKSNREYWLKKIPRNMRRDKEVSDELRKLGWSVLRFWESDILRNPQRCARKVERAVKRRLPLSW